MQAKLVSEQDRIIQIQQQLGRQVHEAVLSDAPVDKIIKDICDQLLDVMNANYVAVFIREKSISDRPLIKVHYLNVSQQLRSLLEKAENMAGISRNDLRIELSDNSGYRELYEAKQILEINDHQRGTEFLKDKVAFDSRLQKLAPSIARMFGKKLDYSYYLPLIAQNEMIGHLEIGRGKDKNFSDSEKAFLQSIVLELAVAIDYRRKQERIQTTMDMFNEFVEGSDDQIYYKDPEGRFMYLNSSMALTLRLSNPQEAIGKKESEILEQEHIFKREEHEKKVIESKQERKFVDTLKIEDGISKYSYRSIIPYYDSQGLFRGILGIDRDITDLQHSVNKISLSEDWYQALFDSSKDGIVLLKSAIMQDCNPKMLEMLGIEKEEAVGRSPFDFSPEYQGNAQDSKGLGLRYISRALAGEPQTFKWLHRNKAGETIPTVVSLKRLTVNHHTYLVAVVQDLRDLEQLSDELKIKTRELNLFNSIAMDQLMVTDAEGRILKVNDVWQEELGYESSQLIGKSFYDFIHQDDLEMTMRSAEKIIQAGELNQFVNRWQAKDGSYHYLEWRARIYQGNLYGAARDVTENRKREQTIRDALKKAQELDQLKTDFLNRMSHETRTPLSSILGLAEVLKDQEYDEEKIKQLETILDSGKHLLSLINNMLELASVEAGNVVLQQRQVVLAKLLQEIKRSYRENEATNIELKLDIPDELSKISINTDDVKLKQIFQHLLNNAFKFSSRGTIAFGYFLRDNHLVLYVQDEGIGFSEEAKKAAFDSFEQAEGGTTRAKGGVGIGLAIVKKYVQLLGGDIKIISSEGKGSRFEFNIKHDPITPGVQKVGERSFDGHGHIILVAEDEAINMMMADMILKNSNYTVLKANNGKEALEKATSRSDITAILMDISMPVMDGFEATGKIKELRPGLPVYAVTAHSRSDIQQKLDDNGFDDYFNKPYNKQDILNKLQDLVDGEPESED